MILNSPYISGSLTVTGNIITSGSITISGSIASASYAVSASEASKLQGLGSSSFAPQGTFNTVSQSYALSSGSLSTRVTNVETTSSVLTLASGSFATMSGSLSIRVTNLESTSSTVSQSYASESGSMSSRVTLIEGQYATTGSNTFTNVQYISSTVNAQGFATSASLYTDGGLRVAKDSFISGTAYFNNVIVYGTASIQYVTASQINVGANIIYLNTQTPAVRYGGMAVADSGSNAGVTGSMLWDSVNNGWIYTRESGSNYSSGALISGPKSSVQGSEQSTIANYIMKGQGGDHITGSQIYDDGTTVQIPGNLQVTGSISGSSAVYSGTIIASNGTASTSTTTGALVVTGGVGIGGSVYATNGLLIGNGGATATSNYLPKFTGTSTIGNSVIQEASSNIGIGGSPSGTYGKLSVFGGLSIKDDNNAKLEIGRYSSGASNSYIKLGTNSNSLRFTNAGDLADIMELTNSGNLGLGVTPSAWGSGSTAFQIGNGAIWKSGSRSVDWIANGYYDGTNYIYNLTNAATFYRQYDGQHQWFNAPSGTAGNAITFTQAMTLTAAGNLGIGTTSPTRLFDVSATNPQMTLKSTTTTGFSEYYFSDSAGDPGYLSYAHNGDYLVFGVNSAERIRITSGGNVLIGTSTDSGYKLDVNGTGRFTSDLRVLTGGKIYYETSGTGNSIYRDSATGNSIFTSPVDFKFTNATASTTYLTLTSSTGAATFSSTLQSTHIGINTAPTGARLYATQTTDGEWIATFKNYGGSSSYGVSIDMSGSTSTQSALQIYTPTGTGFRFHTNGRLTIGTFTDNGYLLDVNGTGRFSNTITSTSGNNTYSFIASGATTGYNLLKIQNSGGQVWLAVESSVGGTLIGGSQAYAALFGNVENAPLQLFTNASVRLTIASTGAATFGHTLTIGGTTNMSGTDVNSVYTDARVNSAVTGTMVGYGVRMVALSPSSGSYTVANMYAIKTSTPVVQPNVTVTNSYGIYIGRTDDPSSGGVVTNKYALVTEATAGNSGIGTVSPTNGKLEIQETATTAALWVQTGGTTSGYVIADFRTGTNASALQILGTGAATFSSSVTATAFTAGGAGSGGAGTLTVRNDGGIPASIANEAVSGTLIRFSGNGSGVLGSISHNGTSVAYNTSSDYRLKEDLKEISGLDKISAIKVYDFKWKVSDDRTDGVLAHELQEVLPYAVTGEKDGEEMQGVDYSKLVPVLVKAIQEQQTQIQALKARIETLEK